MSVKENVKLVAIVAASVSFSACAGLYIVTTFPRSADFIYNRERTVSSKGANQGEGGPEPRHALEYVTLGVLVLQAGIYWRQAGLMRGQLEAAIQGANAAKIQAETAKTTISTLERPHIFPIIQGQNFRGALKTYLMYDNPASGPPGFQETPNATVSFKNYGRSPAIITAIGADITLGGFSPPDRHLHIWLPLPDENVLLHGAATQTFGIGRTNVLSAPSREDFIDLRSRGSFWWLTGFICYDDVIGYQHKTFFCWRYDYGMDVFEPLPPERNFTESNERKQVKPDEHPGMARMRGMVTYHDGAPLE